MNMFINQNMFQYILRIEIEKVNFSNDCFYWNKSNLFKSNLYYTDHNVPPRIISSEIYELIQD